MPQQTKIFERQRPSTALIQKNITFKKFHDVGAIGILVLSLNPELSDLMKEADTLTDYAVMFRYPDAVDGREPTIEDAKIGLAIAKKVFKKMASMISFESTFGI